MATLTKLKKKKAKKVAIRKTKKKKNQHKPIIQKRGRIKVRRAYRKIKLRGKKKTKSRKSRIIRARVKLATKKTTYVLNTDFGSFFELRDLILKSLPAEKDSTIEKINKLGKVKLA
ncbi:MAG: hypothetical protein HYT65_02400, partial [Candidatus Yanofskybacteria bacterium]|nr:hypothetical protein [Candidatus Yanofskybacteria bacterium]